MNKKTTIGGGLAAILAALALFFGHGKDTKPSTPPTPIVSDSAPAAKPIRAPVVDSAKKPEPKPVPNPPTGDTAKAPTPPVGTPPPPRVAVDVKADSSSITLPVGASSRAAAHAVDATGATLSAPIAYSVEKPGVVSIDSTGRVTALASGVTRVVALLNGHHAYTTVTVPAVASAPPPVVTPPAPALTPGPAPSSSSRNGLSGLQLIGDDYSRYVSTADVLKAISKNLGGTGDVNTALYHDGRGAQYVSLDSSVTYSGHPTLRYAFIPGASNDPPELWPSISKPLDEMWLRVVLRFSPGFTTVGTASAANAYKLLGWGLTGGNGSGRIEITNTDQYELYWNLADYSTNASYLVAEQFGQPGRVSTEWKDGAFYVYVVHWKKLSTSSVLLECWIRADGASSGRYASTTTTMQPGKTAPQVSAINLGMNFNQNVVAPMAINYGQWEVVDGVLHPDPFHLAGSH